MSRTWSRGLHHEPVAAVVDDSNAVVHDTGRRDGAQHRDGMQIHGRRIVRRRVAAHVLPARSAGTHSTAWLHDEMDEIIHGG